MTRASTILACVLLLSSCGSSYYRNDLLDPDVPRDPDPVVVLSQTGVGPRVIHVNFSVPVRFINEDSVAHVVTDAPDLGYGECPAIRQIGSIAPGQTVTAAMDRYGVCAFRDTAQPSNPAYQALLVVH